MHPAKAPFCQFSYSSLVTLLTGTILSLFLVIPGLQAGEVYENQVTNLAQKCFSIQSVHNGKYLKKFHEGGLTDGGMSFQFSSVSLQEAEKFFFKPTSFFNFLITDAQGAFLGTHLPASLSANTYASRYAEWKIRAKKDSEGKPIFQLKSNKLGLNFRHWLSTGKVYFINIFTPFPSYSEDWFRLIPDQGCLPFPEASLNLQDTESMHTSHIESPVRGFMDPHAHITSYEFMGGKMLHGDPFHKWGISKALSDSSTSHGYRGMLDIIGNFQAYNDVNFRYDTTGYPDFNYWPNHKTHSHTGYYYRWIERAHKGGLKLMVTHLVENEVLCNIQRTVNPSSWFGSNSCNTMDSIRLQISRLREMEAYIDAQEGGPGKGFFRLVTSPLQARKVISEGKLAVIMGIEASELFNCGLKDICSEETVERDLQEVYREGVRVLFPLHRFDNKFGGTRIEDGVINIGNWLSTGHFFESTACDEETRGARFTNGFPIIGQIPVFKQILDLIDLNPEYDESIRHCNQRGLTELGSYLINRMIDMGMIIEIDHMSTKTASDAISIIESRNYSGMVSSHGHMNSDRDGNVHSLMVRLAQAGGILSVNKAPADRMQERIDRFLDVTNNTIYSSAIPFSTDMGGLSTQAGPRADADRNPLNYPFVTESGVTISRQKTGNREFDLNRDGLAHYGLLADYIQDIREKAPEHVYEAIMNSAEAYISMWERASSRALVNEGAR